MTENKNKKLDFSLILPSTLLVLIIVVVLVLLALGYEITPLLRNFLILMTIYLLYQIGMPLFAKWQIKRAVDQINEGNQLFQSGRIFEAIRLWKGLLLKLPKEFYDKVLEKLETAYDALQMTAAVQQVKAIRAASQALFAITQKSIRPTIQDRKNWQAQAYQINQMIKALPEEKPSNL